MARRTRDALPRLGLGFVGAGRFARFIASVLDTLPELRMRVVADQRLDAARGLAARHEARATTRWEHLLGDPDVDIIVVATPPASHAEIAIAALEAGKHVFSEKPLALDDESAQAVVAAVARTRRVLVVDHVLRYNPLPRALIRLQEDRLPGPLLGPLRRFCFENDASDEDLDENHWFWDERQSGGIFVEHGVHFFDAATLLFDKPADSVHASNVQRRHGHIDLVSATAQHGGDALATHTHSFTHANRCERQLMRLDYGAAEVLVDGWIPVRAVVDAWTDDRGLAAAQRLPNWRERLLTVDGFRLGPGAHVTVQATRDAGHPPQARDRGMPLVVPHHITVELGLGGHAAKSEVYAECVRACLTDLVRCIVDGSMPASNARTAAAAVSVAATAARSARLARTLPVPDRTAALGHVVDYP